MRFVRLGYLLFILLFVNFVAATIVSEEVSDKPFIKKISPSKFSNDKETVLKIEGGNFLEPLAINVSSTLVTDPELISVVSESLVLLRVFPGVAAGKYKMSVITLGGESNSFEVEVVDGKGSDKFEIVEPFSSIEEKSEGHNESAVLKIPKTEKPPKKKEKNAKTECIVEKILWEKSREFVGDMAYFSIYTNGFCEGEVLKLNLFEKDILDDDKILSFEVPLSSSKVIRHFIFLDEKFLGSEFSFFEGDLELVLRPEVESEARNLLDTFVILINGPRESNVLSVGRKPEGGGMPEGGPGVSGG
ncbi:hypothetical protein D6829_02860, partial [Candidatus Pacearchaeota archaeon]